MIHLTARVLLSFEQSWLKRKKRSSLRRKTEENAVYKVSCVHEYGTVHMTAGVVLSFENL